MPGAALKKKPVEAAPALDERGPLTDAIYAEFAAKNAVAAKEAAISRCRLGIDEAEQRLERAQKAIAKAKETDAVKAAAAVSAGRNMSGTSHTQRAEAAVEEAEHLVEVATAARRKLEQDLSTLKDDLAEASNAITIAIKELLKPLARQLIDRLSDARRRSAIDMRVLSELLADDPRATPQFVDELRESKARKLRDAVLAELKAEAARPLYGATDADHELGLQAAKAVKAALIGLRTSAAAPLPKV
jgi:hypothetical protein